MRLATPALLADISASGITVGVVDRVDGELRLVRQTTVELFAEDSSASGLDGAVERLQAELGQSLPPETPRLGVVDAGRPIRLALISCDKAPTRPPAIKRSLSVPVDIVFQIASGLPELSDPTTLYQRIANLWSCGPDVVAAVGGGSGDAFERVAEGLGSVASYLSHEPLLVGIGPGGVELLRHIRGEVPVVDRSRADLRSGWINALNQALYPAWRATNESLGAELTPVVPRGQALAMAADFLNRAWQSPVVVLDWAATGLVRYQAAHGGLSVDRLDFGSELTNNQVEQPEVVERLGNWLAWSPSVYESPEALAVEADTLLSLTSQWPVAADQAALVITGRPEGFGAPERDVVGHSLALARLWGVGRVWLDEAGLLPRAAGAAASDPAAAAELIGEALEPVAGYVAVLGRSRAGRKSLQISFKGPDGVEEDYQFRSAEVRWIQSHLGPTDILARSLEGADLGGGKNKPFGIRLPVDRLGVIVDSRGRS
ncbi:MAG: hypothetical protein HY329_00410 [Chloroflexi bacterium]|nr:hypothetical protein [Chloroflexota bacterium]